MGITCEEKLTAEIRRTLWYLGESCRQQGLTIEQAVDLWSALAESEEIQQMEAQDKLLYREKAQRFVEKYIDGDEKDICVEVLCFLKNQEECPTSNEIVEAISSKVILVKSKKYRNDYIRDVVWDFLKAVEGKRCRVNSRKHWGNVRKRIFILAKTL